MPVVIGMDRMTGKALDATAHIIQCVADILTTPLGSMPWRRDYGASLIALMDQPASPALSALIRAATAIAIGRWEPRLKVTRVAFRPPDAAGAATLSIDALRLDLPQPTPFSFSINV